MTTFSLVRHEDVSGISGTGVVAKGWRTPSGKLIFEWLSDHPSLVQFDSEEGLLAKHGHSGKTEVSWDDESRTPLQRMANYLNEGGECYSIRTPVGAKHNEMRFAVHIKPEGWDGWLAALGGSSDASVYEDRDDPLYPQEHRWTSPDGVVTVLHLVRKEAS